MEKEGVLEDFKRDLYGCQDGVLSGKRKWRNPFRTRHGYEVTCPELKGLLRWCGEEDAVKDGITQIYEGDLPWREDSRSS